MEVVTYTVPSQSQADIRYTVTLWEGDAHCNCPWGARSGETPIVCWHIRLTRAIEHADTLIPDLVYQNYLNARRGAIITQLFIIRYMQDLLLENSLWGRASKCAEMQTKYFQALSFAGAEPARIEEKKQDTIMEEAEAVASSATTQAHRTPVYID